MQTRQLGTSDLEITRLGIGAPAAPGSDEDTLRAMAHAHDYGVNWIDAGDATGHTEQLTGEFLSSLGEVGRPYVFTRGKGDPSFIVRGVEDTLRRLRLEAIDLYQVDFPGGDAAIDGVTKVLADLKSAGKVRHVGVCNLPIVKIEHVAKSFPIAAVHCTEPLHGEAAAELLSFCQRSNIGVLNTPPDSTVLKETLDTIAEEHHVEPQAIAIAWALRDGAITGALVQAESATQMEHMLVAAKLRLSMLDVARIEEQLKRPR